VAGWFDATTPAGYLLEPLPAGSLEVRQVFSTAPGTML
jgi:hypothetical protein